MGGFIAILNQTSVGADLVVAAGDEFEKTHYDALFDLAKGEGRSGVEQPILLVGQKDNSLLEAFRVCLLDLPDGELPRPSGRGSSLGQE